MFLHELTHPIYNLSCLLLFQTALHRHLIIFSNSSTSAASSTLLSTNTTWAMSQLFVQFCIMTQSIWCTMKLPHGLTWDHGHMNHTCQPLGYQKILPNHCKNTSTMSLSIIIWLDCTSLSSCSQVFISLFAVLSIDSFVHLEVCQ